MLFAAVAIPGAGLSAQAVERTLAIGATLPSGSYSRTRTVGPAVRAGVAFGDPSTRRARVRLEIEAAWLISRGAAPSFANSDPGTLSAMSIIMSGVFGRRPQEGTAPYVITGLALQRITIPGKSNPYGSTVGARVGAGLQRRIAARHYFAEIAAHLALTDFGTGSDFGTAAYIPVVIGIRF